MLKIINKECLNNIQQEIYCLLEEISTEKEFISSVFLLIKQQETQDALLKFLKQNDCLKKDDVLLKAVANSQRLALHHTL